MEQINNSKEYVDFIVQSIVGENAEGDDVATIKDKLKLEIMKDVVPSINWAKFEKI